MQSGICSWLYVSGTQMVCSVHCPHSHARHHLQCPAGSSYSPLLPSRRSSRQGRAHRLTTFAAPVAVSTGHHTAQADAQDCSSRDRLHATEAVDSIGDGPSTSGRQQHIAVFRAKKSASMPLREGQRPLGALFFIARHMHADIEFPAVPPVHAAALRCTIAKA